VWQNIFRKTISIVIKKYDREEIPMSLAKDLMEIDAKLDKVLSVKRMFHTRGVMHMAAALAMCYGADIRQACYAGLLHDCAKYLTEEEQLAQCKKYKLPVRDIERKNAYLLHAKVGACFAREKYGVQDEEVLSAITWHTTGRPDMALLEKLIFVADYIEPSRKNIEGMDTIRRLAFQDLDEAVYQILDNTLNYLKKDKGGKKKEIDTMTQEAYNYYKERRHIYGDIRGIKENG